MATAIGFHLAPSAAQAVTSQPSGGLTHPGPIVRPRLDGEPRLRRARGVSGGASGSAALLGPVPSGATPTTSSPTRSAGGRRSRRRGRRPTTKEHARRAAQPTRHAGALHRADVVRKLRRSCEPRTHLWANLTGTLKKSGAIPTIEAPEKEQFGMRRLFSLWSHRDGCRLSLTRRVAVTIRKTGSSRRATSSSGDGGNVERLCLERLSSGTSGIEQRRDLVQRRDRPGADQRAHAGLQGTGSRTALTSADDKNTDFRTTAARRPAKVEDGYVCTVPGRRARSSAAAATASLQKDEERRRQEHGRRRWLHEVQGRQRMDLPIARPRAWRSECGDGIPRW